MTANRKPTKAANGAGSVYQLANGKWVAKLTINGKTVTRTCPTENGAKKALRE